MKIRDLWKYRFFLVVLTGLLAFTGCGGSKNADESEDEEVIQADTANVDIAPTEQQEKPAQKEEEKPQETVAASEPAEIPKEEKQQPEKKAEPETASVAPTPSMTGQMSDYKVRRGDTLMKIAFKLYGDIMQWKKLHEWNSAALSSSANQLKVGTMLKYEVPATTPEIAKNGEPYKIKRGDTLGSIAEEIYAKRSKWKKLWENNKTLIKDPNRIYAGFYIYYQITEEERRKADERRMQKSQQQVSQAQAPASSTEQTPATPAPTTNSNSSTPAASEPAASGNSSGNSNDGLSALASPNSGRSPASTSSNDNKKK